MEESLGGRIIIFLEKGGRMRKEKEEIEKEKSVR